MALVLADRVKETTTTTGTGTLTLLGASAGYQSFAVIGNANTTYYCIAGQTTTEWEVGIGTYTSAGTTLARTTVLANSAGTQPSALSFSAGTKDVFVTYPAGKSVNLDASGNVSSLGTVASGTWNASTIGPTYGGTGFTSYAVGDILYADTTTSLAKLADVAVGNALISGGVGSAPSWGKIGLATHVSGTLPAANGGTGVNNGSNTITVAGNLSHAGAFTQTFTATANTSLTLPASGTLISTVTNMAANPVTGTPSASNFLRGDGTWAVASTSPGGSNTQVQYNSSGSFAGSANLTFDGTNLSCGGNVNASSDETLKTNWRDFPPDYVEQLAKVKHGTYDRIDVELTQDGVSAQSLRNLMPNSVGTGEDGKLNIAYGNAALVAAIKLAQRIVQLEARLQALENK
jgi:hypothetical protein